MSSLPSSNVTATISNLHSASRGTDLLSIVARYRDAALAILCCFYRSTLS